MAVPIRLRKVPEYLQNPEYSQSMNEEGTDLQELLQFPKSTCVLWDGTSTGPPVFLHVAQNRKPRLQLWEKVLWLIHKQVDYGGTASRVLTGSLSVENDAEGVSFHIDRLDTRQVDVDSSLVQDDVLIPVQLSVNGTQDKTGSKEDYTGAIKMLQKRCCSRGTLELNSMLLVKGWCSFRSPEHAEKTIAHVQFDVVTLATVFKATPVNPVPIIPSALAKNLGGPRSLSQMQGRPKMGYLSMDATRKLLLVLESDPKVSSLPVVGLWVSGVSMVHHPFVWASCLRYLHNERLQDRVCTPPEGFLVVLYTYLHSKPEFYEVCTTSGKSDLDYNLYTGSEYASLFKKSSGPEPGIIELELCPVLNGPKRESFDAALEGTKFQRQEPSSSTANPLPLVNEDIVPRMMPAPHQAKAMVVKPMVPEVSMIWNEDNFPSQSVRLPFSSAPRPPFSALPVFPAPASIGRCGVGPVLSSRSGEPTANTVYPSSASGNCHAVSNGLQSNECMPRIGFPGQYQQSQNIDNQNNGAKTHFPGAVPSAAFSGFLATAYNNGVPYSTTTSQPHTYSQHGINCSNMVIPPHGSQGPVAVLQHDPPPPQMLDPVAQSLQPQSLQPQTQFVTNLQPRLTAPAALHFCQPSHAGQAVHPARSFPHPSQNVQRLHHGSSIPQPSAILGQQSRKDSNHPQSHISQPMSWPSQPAVIADQAAIHHNSVAVQRQKTNAQSSTQVTVPHSLMSGPHLQKTAVCSKGPIPMFQAQNILPHRIVDGSNPQAFPQAIDQARSGGTQPVPFFQTHPSDSYTQQPSFGGHPASHSIQGTSQSVTHSTAPAVNANFSKLAMHTGNDSHQSDSASCSGKSSDDSGLSVTPDRSNPSPKPPASPLAKVGAGGGAAMGLEGVNWSGVPSEVVELLAQQDAQLKVLQAQIQQLLTQQQQQHTPVPAPATHVATPSPSPSSGLSTPSTLKRETCSTAVNTTIVEPESPWGRSAANLHCVSVQTSPLKSAQPLFQPCPGDNLSVSNDAHTSPQRLVPPFHCDSTLDGKAQMASGSHIPTGAEADSAGETPSEVLHRGPVQMSSTEHEEGLAVGTSSLHSCRSLEQPSPVRSVESGLQMSHSTPSPQSASMCVCQDDDEENTAALEISPDSKEYYDQLINNIRLFLNSHSQDEESSKQNHPDTPQDEQTYTRLHYHDSTLAASPSVATCPSGGTSSNTTLMPHINYLSMMLGSETDASVEINAMAMKYLRDEQLTQVARHHQSPLHMAGGTSNQLLRQVLAASLDATGASDVSGRGMSATNMSMATKKYMEKYGLLGDQGESILDSNQTIRLQTDFSLAVMSEPHSDPSVPSSPLKSPPQSSPSPLHAGSHSPVKREKLQQIFKPSPTITEEENSYEESSKRRDFEDLGASPALRPPLRYHQHRDPSPEDTPIFPERYRGGPASQDCISDSSVATEDDRILDIERLKQMPKLL